MDFRRPFYAEGRLKAAWVLYRTIAWALPMDDVCGNDGEWYEVPYFRGQSPRDHFLLCRTGNLQVGLTVLALSLALSHGEGEQMAENHSNGRTLPSLREKENKLQGITTIVEFQSS